VPGSTSFVATWPSRTSTSGGIPTANRAELGPIPGLATGFTFTTFTYVVDNASGNLDLGVYYTDDSKTFYRLISTGSFTPSAGAGTYRATVNSTSLIPVPGRKFYMAHAWDNAVARYDQYFGGPDVGYFKNTSFPLPATIATPSASTVWAEMIIS